MPAMEMDMESEPFARSGSAHDVHTTIHHWQLRDLVSAGDTQNEFYYVYDQSVLVHNTITEESTSALNTDFCPNSMTYAHGILAAGGPNSQLVVKSVEDKRIIHRGPLGGSVNNALHLARTDAGLSLFACNNDLTIKVFVIGETLIPSCTVRCDAAANHCGLSPDGRRLAAVGDSDETCVYTARESGYELEQRFRVADDAGMGVSWASSGFVLASAHQDGTIVVMDTRAQRLVHKYELTAPARSVKFCPGGVMDLLAFAEHEDVVHVADARAWARTQRLNAGCHEGHDISGLAFSKVANRLFVGLDHCVMTYELDTVARRSFASGVLL